MIKTALMLVTSLSLTLCLHGQNIDSLRALIQSEPSDSVRCESYLSLAESMLRINKDSFLYYSRKAFDISSTLASRELEYKAVENIGYFYRTEGKYDSSLMFYNKALNLGVLDSSLISKTYYNIGNVLKAKGDLSEAGDNYLKSLKISEQSKNVKGAAIANLGLGSLFLVQKKVELSVDYFHSARTGFEKVGDRRGVYISTNNLGTALFNLNKFSEAKPNFQKAEETALVFRDLIGLSDIYSNLGIIYNKENRLDSSLYYHKKALNLRKKFNLTEGVISSYHNLVELSILLGNLRSAELYLDSARIRNNEINNLSENKFYWNYKTILDTAKNDFESAFNSLIKYHGLRDSLENIEVSNRLLELQTQYETEKKDNEIASLSQQAEIQQLKINQRNIQLIGAVIVLLLASIGGYAFYQQRKLKHQQAVSDMEQRMLRLQMNPHFIFNALASIQSYILQSDTKESVKYLAKFGKLMRQILEHSREESISIAEEADMLTNYIQIQQLRFQNRFDYEIVVDEQIDQEETFIPPLFAQPFVENAIEHGLKDVERDGKITIRFIKENAHIRLEVEDNGSGISTKVAATDHKSLATIISKERLEILGKRFHQKFSIAVENSTSATGIKATITLPVFS